MDKDLEIVLWMVSVQLKDMRKNIKNGLPIDMEMLDGIINGIEAVMNGSEGETSNDASALPIPDVSESVCPICHGTGYYSYGGSFGGATMTQQCSCRANVR